MGALLLCELTVRLLLLTIPSRDVTGGRDGSVAGELTWLYEHPRWINLSPDQLGQGALYHPTLGWTAIPLRDGTDALGRRGADLPRDAGAVRVVLLGDSFTYGTDAAAEVIFPTRIETKAPRIDVVNRGVFAYGHDQMVLAWEQDLDNEADVVVLVAVSPDIERNLHPFFFYAKPRMTEVGSVLQPTNTPIEPPPPTARTKDLDAVPRGRPGTRRHDAQRSRPHGSHTPDPCTAGPLGSGRARRRSYADLGVSTHS